MAGSKILAFPQARLTDLLRIGPFRATLRSYLGLHSSGRAAIRCTLERIGCRPGSTVWMPAFHCGVEIEAAAGLGLKVQFYNVKPDLNIDLEHLSSSVRRDPGPVLVVHYFGFPQPQIRQLVACCERLGVPVIEDCAHSLFSRYADRPLGEFAPFAVFSLRKTLPLLEGGACQGNVQPFSLPRPRSVHACGGRHSLTPYKIYLKATMRRWVGEGVARRYRRTRSMLSTESEPAGISPCPFGYEGRLSSLSRCLASAADPAAIIDGRRRNWLTLSARLSRCSGFVPVFSDLPEGVCPLFLPVWIAERPSVIERMDQLGVETFVFGANAHPMFDCTQFRHTAVLRERILCLPVHQQLTSADVERIAEVFSRTVAACDLEHNRI